MRKMQHLDQHDIHPCHHGHSQGVPHHHRLPRPIRPCSFERSAEPRRRLASALLLLTRLIAVHLSVPLRNSTPLQTARTDSNATPMYCMASCSCASGVASSEPSASSPADAFLALEQFPASATPPVQTMHLHPAAAVCKASPLPALAPLESAYRVSASSRCDTPSIAVS